MLDSVEEFKKRTLGWKVNELLLHYRKGHDAEYLEKAAIFKAEMDRAEDDLLFFEALKQCGVDNWDGYEDAAKLYQSWLKEND